jgi:hypothetical protein
MANLEDRQECQGCESREACRDGDWSAVGIEGCLFWQALPDMEEASEYEDYHS